MTKESAQILILDGNQRSALAFTRALGRAGYCVVTASTEPRHLASSSKHSNRALTYPDPVDSPKEFLQWIADQDWSDYLLPMTDVTMELCLTNLHLISAKLPFGTLDAYQFMSNKANLVSFAQANGIRVPVTESVIVGKLNPQSLAYPFILKPEKSMLEVGGTLLSTKVLFIQDSAALTSALAEHTWLGKARVLMQEVISGVGYGIFVHAVDGKVIDVFAHQRVREKPPSGGVSVCSMSIEAAPSLVDAAHKIVHACHWTGIAMVEFKGENPDQAVLMEVNARPWGSIQLAIDCGVNFPLKLVVGESGAETASYKIGHQLRWIQGELDHAFLIWKLGYPSGVFTKLVWTMRALCPFYRKSRFELLRLEDPKPFFSSVLSAR